MYKYLGRHPQITPSLRKEIEYFTINYGHGEAWYRAHFPLNIRGDIATRRGGTLKSFEATPDYLFFPNAPSRVAALLPDAQCIVVLRDPAERAYSHYSHNVRLGQEDLSFEDAIAAEETRLARDRIALRNDADDRVLNFRRFSYLARGDYAGQIARWFEQLPRDRFHFVFADDLFNQPEATLHRILRFVDLPAWSPPEFRNYSYPTSAGSGSPTMPIELHDSLRSHFDRHDQKLEALLDTSLPWRRAT